MLMWDSNRTSLNAQFTPIRRRQNSTQLSWLVTH